MNRIFLLLFFVLTSAAAQNDGNFYFPEKEWGNTENYNLEEFFFSSGSDTLSTILVKPKVEPKATILYFHGALGNVTTYLPMVKPLTSGGYQVFMVDFRGYGKSTGKPTHQNIAKDAELIFQKMQEMEAFRDQKILVYGGSMGTQIATKLSKDHQDQISALILDGTISSFVDIALQYSAPALHDRIKSEAGLYPYSALEDIKEIEDLPKLFIHSKEDKDVDFSQAQKVFEAAKEPKEFWIYEGDHLQAPLLRTDTFLKKIDALLESTIQ